MKAIVQDRYGGPEALELAEIDRPPLGDRDALVRVHAASIHFGDQMIMRGKPKLFRPIYGFGKPRSRVPGLDIAGTVEAVGTGVTRFGPGEEVFGTCTGALAEYVGTWRTSSIGNRRTSPSSRPRPFPPPGSLRSTVSAMRGRCSRAERS